MALLGVLCLGAAACATSSAYNRGKDAYLQGEYDVAVANFRDALQEHPDRTDYKGALQQAMSTASLAHLKAAREADEKGDLELAVARVPQGLRVRPVQPQRDAARGRDRQGTARARRGGTAAAGDRRDA